VPHKLKGPSLLACWRSHALRPYLYQYNAVILLRWEDHHTTPHHTTPHHVTFLGLYSLPIHYITIPTQIVQQLECLSRPSHWFEPSGHRIEPRLYAQTAMRDCLRLVQNKVITSTGLKARIWTLRKCNNTNRLPPHLPMTYSIYVSSILLARLCHAVAKSITPQFARDEILYSKRTDPRKDSGRTPNRRSRMSFELTSEPC
jgi:hypothetical protein